ncbi:hypothetical protein DRV85_12725 [Rhodosalinus halophilus]|uniref:HTH luxR-type domain-containing protein n=1 Tax=Rhodosalinus halophilus TaxID=2259333 RepID=A0A365U6W9_9RHOB|nr:helix-turn-helix transcriptional regulator [Rhodosalinus halophilus]RBI84302.1 hypothetical protein DRV85_12725 [Rhodosalinus halophilus]
MTGRAAILGILVRQGVSALVFVATLLIPVLGVPVTYDWRVQEAIEIGAAVGLVAGVAIGGVALRRTQVAHAQAQDRLRMVSGAFADLMEERFESWGLTPAERDVALFSIKGLTTAEIASVRNTSEGTVKAQTNAIYRKAGVNGRAQLLSLFIEDLLDDRLSGSAAQTAG